MKKFLFSAVALAYGLSAFAGVNSGAVLRDGNSFLVRTAGETVMLTPVSDDIIRVSSLPLNATTARLPRSQSAIMPEKEVTTTTFLTPSEFTLLIPNVIAKVDRKSGNVTFLNRYGDTLLTEAGGVDNTTASKNVRLSTSKGENFYGAGERGHSFRINGDTLPMYNRPTYGYGAGDKRISQMNITMPYYTSDKGYGILFDDYNTATLIMGDTISYESETPKPLSYYFINGGSLAGTTCSYADLTGHQDLPPFWTLGYITSKYGYHTEQEALGAIDSLKRAGYPVDGIIFDLYWYGKETDMGRLEWNKNQFPDHKRMLDSLNAMGVHTVLIHQPYINKNGAIDNYNTLDAKYLLTKDADGKRVDVQTWVGEAGMFDISNNDTREWLWNRLKPLTAEGLSGWWGDLGEPEVHPESIVHANGETAGQFHNAYGNEWSRLIYEGLRKDFPEMRPMLLMRGGTSGLQRYSVFPWTGDVARSWGGLQAQVPLMLNSGISGLGYMSSDIGGFAVDHKAPYLPELYVRWLELGTFSPVLRTHAQFKPEPYHYPQYAEILKKFIRMRYEWLPYNYTLAYDNAKYGLPLVRPLNFNGDNPGEKYANVQDEYMWGEEVLVAPVMTEGARSRKVLFPAGEWINWNNPSLRYKGGSTATVQAPLGTLPLFVKAGSFIPQYTRKIENVGEYDPSELTVVYFPSDFQNAYTLFEDNRKSPDSLEKGEYRLTTFIGVKEGKTTRISIKSEGTYPGMPEVQKLTIRIPATTAAKSATGAKAAYDAATRSILLTLDYTGEAEISITQ